MPDKDSSEPVLPPVVDAAWVREHRASLVLVDVRWFLDGRSGYDAYLAGHLPGAVWADVDTVLSAPPDETGGRHPLPDPADFARALGRLGIGDGTTVVAYDADGGPYAARLVWLLRRTGRVAALLDGGLTGWPDATETGGVTLPQARMTPVEWPAEAVRSADEVAAGNAIVLDARAGERYSGETVLPTDIRSGHIPGARSAPWSANHTADGMFAGPGQLRAHYEALGVREGSEVIVYCGSGVTACLDLLALERAGISGAALYPGSWSAWSADLSRPVATGREPG
ncbi:sulfurtransferase [Streptomyces sp. NPDC005786]|uniref:sulfurtransferase n=1 Tax=Streptomyces sp. NPDC005786 TaxID=3154891 RepID=UPI00340F3297